MTTRVASGTVDQYAYFERPTGLSGFTVWFSRNGATPVQMTSPIIAELANMPGTYSLLLDEGMTLTPPHVTEQMVFRITAAAMQDVTIEVELFDASVSALTAGQVWGHILGTTGISASALLQIIAGVSAGKLSGASGETITIRNIEDTFNLVIATVDANGNREAIVINTPDD